MTSHRPEVVLPPSGSALSTMKSVVNTLQKRSSSQRSSVQTTQNAFSTIKANANGINANTNVSNTGGANVSNTDAINTNDTSVSQSFLSSLPIFWHDHYLCHDHAFYRMGHEKGLLPSNVFLNGFPEQLKHGLFADQTEHHDYTQSYNVNGMYSFHREWGVYVKVETGETGKKQGEESRAFNPPSRVETIDSKPDSKEESDSLLILQWCSENFGQWVIHEVPLHAINEDGSYHEEKDVSDDRFLAVIPDSLFSVYGSAPRQIWGEGVVWGGNSNGNSKLSETEARIVSGVELVFGEILESVSGEATAGNKMVKDTAKKSQHISVSGFDYVNAVSNSRFSAPIFCRQLPWNLLVRLTQKLDDVPLELNTERMDYVSADLDPVSAMIIINKTSSSLEAKNRNKANGRILAFPAPDKESNDEGINTKNFELSHRDTLLGVGSLGASNGTKSAQSLENSFRSFGVMVDEEAVSKAMSSSVDGTSPSDTTQSLNSTSYQISIGPTLWCNTYISVLGAPMRFNYCNGIYSKCSISMSERRQKIAHLFRLHVGDDMNRQDLFLVFRQDPGEVRMEFCIMEVTPTKEQEIQPITRMLFSSRAGLSQGVQLNGRVPLVQVMGGWSMENNQNNNQNDSNRRAGNRNNVDNRNNGDLAGESINAAGWKSSGNAKGSGGGGKGGTNGNDATSSTDGINDSFSTSDRFYSEHPSLSLSSSSLTLHFATNIHDADAHKEIVQRNSSYRSSGSTTGVGEESSIEQTKLFQKHISAMRNLFFRQLCHGGEKIEGSEIKTEVFSKNTCLNGDEMPLSLVLNGSPGGFHDGVYTALGSESENPSENTKKWEDVVYYSTTSDPTHTRVLFYNEEILGGSWVLQSINASDTKRSMKHQRIDGVLPDPLRFLLGTGSGMGSGRTSGSGATSGSGTSDRFLGYWRTNEQDGDVWCGLEVGLGLGGD